MLFIIELAISSELPDFRLIPVFLWGEDHSFDSDGDSYNPASRNWTWLHMHSRELANTPFEIEQSENDLSMYIIRSDNKEICSRIAFFLSTETNGKILSQDGQWNHPNYIMNDLGSDFNLAFALERSSKSCIRKSTLENPYPC